ncbi:CysZ-like protein, partial [Methylobacterium radiotolerans]
MRQTFSPPLRAILWKSLGLTVGLLLLIWLGLTRLIQAFQASHHISAQYPILDSLAYYLAGFGLVVALAYLMPAVSILVAGFFLDDAAEIVERTDFPNEPPGRAMPFGTAMLYALRFAGVTLLVNLAALVIFFVPVIGIAAFFAANAYLLSREYFEMAAARF